jgi:hypothetical protein
MLQRRQDATHAIEKLSPSIERGLIRESIGAGPTEMTAD